MGFCVCLLVLLCLPGCQRRSTFLNQNDELRKENLQLTQQIEALEKQLALRQSELRSFEGAPKPQPVEGADVPRIVGIVVGRYTGGIDLTRDGVPDELRVYVRPVDQQGRFMSSAGTARVRLLEMDPEADPVTLLDQRYDPEAFDNAYRSGVTGTHYTLTAKLPEDPPSTALLQVSFVEASSGLTFSAERLVPLSGPQPIDPEAN